MILLILPTAELLVICDSITSMPEGKASPNQTREWPTRTPDYEEHLLRNGLDANAIERVRRNTNKLSELGVKDTLTDHFHHEIFNSIIPLALPDSDIEWGPTDFQQARVRLLKMRSALGWFKEEGPLSKQEIIAFLDEAEKQKEWNPQVVERLNRLAETLFTKLR